MSVEAKEQGRFPVRLVVLEAALIAFGVMFALAVTEGWESRKRRLQAEAALGTVTEELRENRSLLTASRNYHAHLLDTLAALRRAQAARVQPSLFTEGFVNPAEIVTTAWETANATGATTDMDYATVLLLSRTYGEFDRYGVQGRTVSDLLYRRLFEGGSSAVVENPTGLASVISTFLYRECQLVRDLDRAVKEMEGGAASAGASRTAGGSDSVEEPPVCGAMLERAGR